jgi:predicted ATP-binding protein involved in virulence
MISTLLLRMKMRWGKDLISDYFLNGSVKKDAFKSVEQLQGLIDELHEKSNTRNLAYVKMALKEFMPEFSDFRVQRKPLRMKATKNGKDYTIQQLSDGQKCFIALVGDLARRLVIANPRSEKPLEGKGVVLIDELDLHLHPEWQQKMIVDLRTTFPNIQFFEPYPTS